jgi:sugar lactone lactonase YvrE
MEKDVAPTLLIPGLTFTEGARWHEDRIWFSDLYTFHVHSACEDGSDLRVEATVPEQPSGLGWLPDGRLLVVSMLDRKLMRREPDGRLVTHADLNGHAVGYLGDVIVDSRGRAYLGNFGFDLYGNEPMKPTSLHRIDPNGEIVEVAQDLWFPNGCAITPDNVLLVNGSPRSTSHLTGISRTVAYGQSSARGPLHASPTKHYFRPTWLPMAPV